MGLARSRHGVRDLICVPVRSRDEEKFLQRRGGQRWRDRLSGCFYSFGRLGSVREIGKRLGEERETESPERVEKVTRRRFTLPAALYSLELFARRLSFPVSQLEGTARPTVDPTSPVRASRLLLKTLLSSSTSRAKSSGHEEFLPKVIFSSLL